MLANQNCVACEPGAKALLPDEIAKLLPQAVGWNIVLDGRAIRRRMPFENFTAALEFVNKVGMLAEEQGHHPDILLGWGYAQFVMWTHMLDGMHENDFIMAVKINQLYDAHSAK